MHFQVICGRAPELLSLKTALALIYRFSYVLYFTVFPLNWSVLLNSLYQHIVQVVHSIWWYSLSTQCQEILKMKEIRCITTFRIFLRELFFFFLLVFREPRKPRKVAMHKCVSAMNVVSHLPLPHLRTTSDKQFIREPPGWFGHPVWHMSLWWHLFVWLLPEQTPITEQFPIVTFWSWFATLNQPI